MSRPFYPPETHILPLTMIRRERALPWPGEVLAGMGQQVEPGDVVARAGRPWPPLILDVTQKLGVSPDQAAKCCLKRPGESIRQGEVLALRKGGIFGSRKIASPVEGMVVAIRAGRMIIDPQPELFELRALLSGVVANTRADFGVTIETPGVLIQAVWGSGQEGYGVLKMGVEEPNAVMDEEQVEAAHHGSILVCGATLDMTLLEKAQEMQARGLIVGGVPAELRERVSQQPLPVVATEGMGRIPISSTIFNLLQANQGRETVLLAITPNRRQATWPEIIIPLPVSTPPESPPPPGVVLSAGLKVRIKRAPYWGAVGMVKMVYNEPHNAENGVRCSGGADVVLEDGTVVFVPNVNLDLIGS